ncbi:uncharacterized protein LOC62_05G007491 [Vanrija pseudolonga]|uniref:Mug135-like C-terminal domain-containing protein n=1 Tax=Vanrija pseudolonga TaxID=143232 RepID=A0AAF0YFF2_9TREE|nr:hypothetical protein LOC62_05G007491 [Vanrija pseudolonga]
MATADPIPIPDELLTHPAIKEHPAILQLHAAHGGIPADASDEQKEAALNFAHAVAQHAVVGDATLRRTDPSPRRTARVWRSQILGHRDSSVSPSQSPVRYRSRSRPPAVGTVKEEPGASSSSRGPGRRDVQVGNDDDEGLAGLENRLNAAVQQQHGWHDDLLKRYQRLEKKVGAGIERQNAMNTNRTNYYLSRPLVPVKNAKGENVPMELPALTSLRAIEQLNNAHVSSWIQYYTGSSVDVKPHAPVPANVRLALRTCIGIDTVLVQ